MGSHFMSMCLLLIWWTSVDTNNSLDGQSVSTLSPQIFNGSANDLSLHDSSLLSNTSLTDLQNDNDTQQLQIRFRERKRQERLFSIQTLILSRLGITGRTANSTKANPISDEDRSLMNRVVQQASPAPTPRTRVVETVTGVNEISSSDIFSERLQSFYPSCAPPNHTDPTLWAQDSGSEMKLFYDITFPRSLSAEREVTAVSAKLRVFKFADPPTRQLIPNNNMGFTVSDRTYQMTSQEGLTVSLYQYMRPLRQNRREKRRLIDSRTIAWNKQGYIEFNIINAINYWQNNPIRNFGLSVEMENPYGVKYNPHLYINPMNCSVQDTPMPNLAQIFPEMANESAVFNADNFPTLDLLTVEMVRQVSVANTTTDGAQRRKRLAIRSTARTIRKTGCRSSKHVVSMKDLNLEDIVLYPTSLEMAVCAGSCRGHRGKHYDCIPTDYKDIEFVYLDRDSNPTIKTLKGLVAQRCHCFKAYSF